MRSSAIVVAVISALAIGAIAIGAFTIGEFAAVAAQTDDPAPEGMAEPVYKENGELILPTNYETWVFVGASLGLSYNEGSEKREGPGNFHHIYIQPQAYEYYKNTGKFPEKTILVMENYSAGSKVNPNLHGFFEDKRVGLEVALKDSETFEERWAYFNFSSTSGLKESARAFPKAVCWDCHDKHAVDDNVFVQFYPVLKREMVAQGRWKEEVHGAEAKTEAESE